LRLFAVACCRHYQHLLMDRRSVEALECGEEMAEGRTTRLLCEPVLLAASEAVLDTYQQLVRAGHVPAKTRKPVGLAEAVWHLIDEETGEGATYNVMATLQSATLPFDPLADLMRCIFGNPFKPVTVDPSWLTWNSSTVVKLAQVIYQQRAFDRL